MMETVPTLIQGDARALPLRDESVDLIVTSPPYFGLRDYGTDDQIGAENTPAEFIAALVSATREMSRVLKPSGSIFVNLGDKYSQRPGQIQSGNASAGAGLGGGARSANHVSARRGRPYTAGPPKCLMMLPERYRIAAIDELGLIARAVLVWSKPNGMPQPATDRVRRTHEDWVHLVRSPRYFTDVQAAQVPHIGPARSVYKRGPSGGNREAGRGRHGSPDVRNFAQGEGGRMPGSVWEVPLQPLTVPAHVGADHYAAFPMEWPRRLIQGWCPPGGTVLDPFGGTGTTALVATMLGRTGISVDLSADYQRIARWRCSDPKERARALGTDASKAIPDMPGQSSLFDQEEAS